MSGWRGMFTGMLALVALEAVVSSTGGAGRIGSALAGAAGAVERLLSPAVPLVPDLRHKRARPNASVTPLPDRRPAAGGSWLSDVQPHKPRTPHPA